MPIYPHDPRTYTINGAALEVYNQLHRGLAETIYCEALAIEFGERVGLLLNFGHVHSSTDDLYWTQDKINRC